LESKTDQGTYNLENKGSNLGGKPDVKIRGDHLPPIYNQEVRQKSAISILTSRRPRERKKENRNE